MSISSISVTYAHFLFISHWITCVGVGIMEMFRSQNIRRHYIEASPVAIRITLYAPS
jgi:hypothetical protein